MPGHLQALPVHEDPNLPNNIEDNFHEHRAPWSLSFSKAHMASLSKACQNVVCDQGFM